MKSRPATKWGQIGDWEAVARRRAIWPRRPEAVREGGAGLGSQWAGTHEVPWNGKSGQGLPAPSGIYFFKIETESTQQVLKAVLLK